MADNQNGSGKGKKPQIRFSLYWMYAFIGLFPYNYHQKSQQ